MGHLPKVRREGRVLFTRIQKGSKVSDAGTAEPMLTNIREYITSLECKNRKLRDCNYELMDLVDEAHGCKLNDGCCEDCYADEGECPIERRLSEIRDKVNE